MGELMNILIYNWRDIENPASGGAEVVLHEIAKRLVKDHNVTLFTSAFSGCKHRTVIDGINVVREGGKFGVYYQAYKTYKSEFEGNIDVIVDAVNTIPFLTPKYVSEPVVSFIFQMTKDVYYEVLPYPIASLANYIEPLLFSFYKKCDAIVMSESIREELVENGFIKERLHVVEPGIDHLEELKPGQKTEYPSVIYMNRIVKYKKPDHAVKAFAKIKEKIPEARLIICGFRGNNSFEGKVKKLIIDLGLSNSVDIRGFVGGKEKHDLLKSSWVHILPSIREGWGLSISEAGACGTPTVGYETVGIRDSVDDGVTGLLSPKGDIDDLASNLYEIVINNEKRQQMGEESVMKAKSLTWDKSAREFGTVLKEACKHEG